MSPTNNYQYGIILPVKNGGAYVKECVNSILSQTHKEFNLIVLDNYSTDDTVAWLKELDDNRITIHTADHPLSMEANWARITATEKNEFITIIGHDDLLHPNYLSVMNALIKKHPQASLYQAHFNFINDKGILVRHCHPMQEKQYAFEFLECEMNRTMDSTGTGYMMRSRDYDAAGGISPLYPNLIFADYELWIKLILVSYKATAAEEAFSYRLHNSASRLTNGEAYQQAFGRYISFLAACRLNDAGIAATIHRHAKKMLLFFCESLSHRLLKTPKNDRVATVGAFIGQCRSYARLLIPGQQFRPLLKLRIFAAYLLDNKIGLTLFAFFKSGSPKIKKQPDQS